MNRRNFLKTVPLTALASTAYLSACENNSQIPIIDTHQHLWDLQRIPLEWVRPPLDQNFLTADYLLATKGLQVEKAIYMEVGAPVAYKREEAKWALALCENSNNPTVGAVISADPTEKEFTSYMQTLAESPFLKGIRYGFNSEEQMLGTQVISNIQWLGKLGLSYDLNIKPQLLNHSARLLDECQDTRFILNHCGNADPVAFFPGNKTVPREPRHDPDQWYRDMELLAQRENIICKISGIVDNLPDYPLTPSDLAPIIDYCFEIFGPDRVIFASDWPVCLRNMTLAQWIELVKQVIANRSITERRKFFYDNANAFYCSND